MSGLKSILVGEKTSEISRVRKCSGRNDSQQ